MTECIMHGGRLEGDYCGPDCERLTRAFNAGERIAFDIGERPPRRSVTLALTPPADFINANDRLHFRVRSELVKQWRAAGRATVEAEFLPYRFDRAHITCAIRFPDNIRRDVGNFYPTAKAIVDGIVDAHLLPDDNDAHVLGPDMRRIYPNGPHQITITIQEIP